MPAQVVPGVHPAGWNARKRLFPVAGFTVQSGRPFDLATTGAAGSKPTSFCVPATASPPDARVTSKETVVPGSPVAVPTSIETAATLARVAAAAIDNATPITHALFIDGVVARSRRERQWSPGTG
jgi:hypothetical protein